MFSYSSEQCTVEQDKRYALMVANFFKIGYIFCGYCFVYSLDALEDGYEMLFINPFDGVEF